MKPTPIANPPNPWASTELEYLDEVPLAKVEIFEDASQSILASNDSPDLGFRFSANPYRGCNHACAYCYARPSHEYLSFGAGTDFDTKIVVKRRAAELLRAAFDRPSWKGDLVMFSGVTDCYQPLEASLRLTRACLEVCATYRNPVAIVTKAPVSTGTELGTLIEGAAIVTAAASNCVDGPVLPARSVTEFAASESTAEPLEHPARVTNNTEELVAPVLIEHPVTPVTETSVGAKPVTASAMFSV